MRHRMRQRLAIVPAVVLVVLLGLAPLAPVGLATAQESGTPEGNAGQTELGPDGPTGAGNQGIPDEGTDGPDATDSTDSSDATDTADQGDAPAAPASLLPSEEDAGIGIMSVSDAWFNQSDYYAMPGGSVPVTLTVTMSGGTAGGYLLLRPAGTTLSGVSVSVSGGFGRSCSALLGPLGNLSGTYGLIAGSATCTISFTVTVNAGTPVGDIPLIATVTSGINAWDISATIHVIAPLSATGTSIAVPYAGSTDGAVTASGGTTPYGFAPGTAPTKGFVTVNADGSFTYTAYVGETGVDQFTIAVSDSGVPAQSATATVDVMIAPEPLAVGGDTIAVSYTGSGDGAVTASGGTPPYTFTIESGPAKGSVVLNPDGTFTYTANDGQSGADQFTVRVADAGEGDRYQEGIATVNVTIGEPLSAQDTAISVAHEGEESGAIAASGGTAPYAFAIETGPTKGTVTLDPATGAFTFTAADDAYGDDMFTVRVTDSGDPQLSAIATVDVTIEPAPLTTETLALAVAPGETVSGDLNDQVSGGVPPYAFALDTAPAKGTVTINADGTFTYTANPDASGSDSFTYTVTDSDTGEVVLLAVTTGTVELTITEQPTPSPTVDPTPSPTAEPTVAPSPSPTIEPTVAPTLEPTATAEPTASPTAAPTQAPAKPTPTPVVVTALPNTGNGATDAATAPIAWLLLGGGVLALGGALTWRRRHSR